MSAVLLQEVLEAGSAKSFKSICREEHLEQMVNINTMTWRVWKKYGESHGIESLALIEKQHLCTKNLEPLALSKKAPLCSNNFNFLLKMNSMSAEPAAFQLSF